MDDVPKLSRKLQLVKAVVEDSDTTTLKFHNISKDAVFEIRISTDEAKNWQIGGWFKLELLTD